MFVLKIVPTLLEAIIVVVFQVFNQVQSTHVKVPTIYVVIVMYGT